MNTDDDVDAGDINTQDAQDFGSIAETVDYFDTDFGELD